MSAFCERERAAWAPPERLTGTEWAERHRVLSREANKPGPYRVKETPWAAGLMDALVADYITHVNFMKPVQIGGTTIGENAIGAWVDMDPSGILIVFSGEDICKKIMRKNIIPMFRTTPKLTGHMTGRPGDVKTSSLKLGSCEISTGWAGSPASLASIPFRRVMKDEVDKYPRWTGAKEADAGSLAEARANTFGHRKKIYTLSTPTIPTGAIATAIKDSGDIRDWCPKCVHCAKHIRPEWEHVTWEGKDVTEEQSLRDTQMKLETGSTKAYYVCPHCEGKLGAQQLWEASRAGGWVSMGKGEPGDHPLSRSVGFRLNGLCSNPRWTGLQGAATKFVKARLGGMAKIHGFYNNVIGVPFWGAGGQGADEALTVTDQHIWNLTKDAGERRVVPDWATSVVAGVDTGKRDHPYVVRAFGPGFQSALLEYGTAESFSELDDLLEVHWENKSGQHFKIRRMCIDSGGGQGTRNMTRTEEVYRYAHKDPARVYAIKGHGGASAPANPIMMRTKHYRPPGDRYQQTLDVRLSILDTGYWKDLLAGYINNGSWAPHSSVGRNYVTQMASEHKMIVRTVMKPDGTPVEDWRWVIKAAGLPNHFWDCFDEETEVLTRGGFVHFKNLTGGEELATVDLTTDTLEYQRPVALIDKPYSGPMVKFGGNVRSRLDLLVTPTHRMVTSDNEVKLAKDLGIRDKLKTRTTWKGVEGLGSEDFAEFLGWYIAEGHVYAREHPSQPGSVKRRIVISQKEGGPWRDQLEDLLGRLPWNWHGNPKGCVITDKDLYETLKPLGDVYTKRVPQWVKDSSPQVISAFVKGAVLGDGWQDGNHQAYCTVSKGLADDMCELYLKMGYGVSVKTKPPGTYSIDGRTGPTVTQYHVHRKIAKAAHLRDGNNKPNFATEDYEGRVYCATVPNGTLVVRRRGKVIIAGNCEVYATVAAHMIGADDIQLEPDLEPAFDELHHSEGGWNSPSSYTRDGSWI